MMKSVKKFLFYSWFRDTLVMIIIITSGKMYSQLISNIENIWQEKINDRVNTLAVITTALDLLDRGAVRVAEKTPQGWIINQWLKKAILLSFRFSENKIIANGSSKYFDKIAGKFDNWDASRFREASIRVVPGAVVRYSAFIGEKTILMPSFINVGANIGKNTMVDTWVTIGSCAQIGANCHISGGVGIGGVLEPVQSSPVIIEDDCFIGARSEIAEGVIIEQGAVLSMGVFIGASTKIVDRASGKIYSGRVPAYSVVVPGSLPGKNPSDPSLYCAVIVKQVDASTRSKTAINELLRETT